MQVEHIYWFAHYNLNGPSARYRGFYPLRFLKKEYGVNYDFVFPERSELGFVKFLKVFLKALFFRKKNSVIVIQKICSNRFYANLLKILVLVRSEHTLYDIDDAEYLRQDTKTLHFFLRHCKLITVGSYALKDYCENYNTNVYINTSPVSEHSFVKKERNKILNVGWVGDFGNGSRISKDFSHKKSMYSILFPQIKLLQIPIELTIIGVKKETDIPEIRSYFEGTPNIKVTIPSDLDWESDDWVYAEIKKFDVGVSPLSDHPFNVSKSAFKAKQYLSVGIPTLASDVGENNKFVKHQENGFLCKNERDFENFISNISAMSDDEYFELSRNAIQGKMDYSIKNYCDSFLSIYQK